jgi:hypothetical protein
MAHRRVIGGHGVAHGGVVDLGCRRCRPATGVAIDPRRPTRVGVDMRRDLGLRQRNGVSVTASIGDQLGKLVARDHAFVNRDVRDLVSEIDVDAGDVWMLTESLFDAVDAGLASKRAGRDSERCLTVAAGIVGRSSRGGHASIVSVAAGVMRRTGHGWVAS